MISQPAFGQDRDTRRLLVAQEYVVNHVGRTTLHRLSRNGRVRLSYRENDNKLVGTKDSQDQLINIATEDAVESLELSSGGDIAAVQLESGRSIFYSIAEQTPIATHTSERKLMSVEQIGKVLIGVFIERDSESRGVAEIAICNAARSEWHKIILSSESEVRLCRITPGANNNHSRCTVVTVRRFERQRNELVMVARDDAAELSVASIDLVEKRLLAETKYVFDTTGGVFDLDIDSTRQIVVLLANQSIHLLRYPDMEIKSGGLVKSKWLLPAKVTNGSIAITKQYDSPLTVDLAAIVPLGERFTLSLSRLTEAGEMTSSSTDVGRHHGAIAIGKNGAQVLLHGPVYQCGYVDDDDSKLIRSGENRCMGPVRSFVLRNDFNGWANCDGGCIELRSVQENQWQASTSMSELTVLSLGELDEIYCSRPVELANGYVAPEVSLHKNKLLQFRFPLFNVEPSRMINLDDGYQKVSAIRISRDRRHIGYVNAGAELWVDHIANWKSEMIDGYFTDLAGRYNADGHLSCLFVTELGGEVSWRIVDIAKCKVLSTHRFKVSSSYARAPEPIADGRYVYVDIDPVTKDLVLCLIDANNSVLARKSVKQQLDPTGTVSDIAGSFAIDRTSTSMFVVGIDNSIHWIALPTLEIQGSIRFGDNQVTAIGIAELGSSPFVGFEDGRIVSLRMEEKQK